MGAIVAARQQPPQPPAHTSSPLSMDHRRLRHWLAQRVIMPSLQVLNRHTVTVLGILFLAGIGGALWNTWQLSYDLISEQAAHSAALYAQTLNQARTLYSSEVVARVQKIPGVKATHDYESGTGQIPIPATYLIQLGHRISDENPGMSVRLYSDYPFPWRQAEGGPRDSFEQEALKRLRAEPDRPYMRMTTFQGRLALRFAQADIMQPSCVACHNRHPDTPRNDWQVGDVRGALEITTPLDNFMAQTRGGLWRVFLMLGGLSALGLVGIGLVVGRLRQTSKELELRVIERTAQLQESNAQLRQEQEKSERLLLNILPPPIATRLKNGQERIAEGFASATILFADLVNFTQWSSEVSPEELVLFLNEMFSQFDALTEQYGLEKIKTIGDAYMVVGGLPNPRPDHARAIAEMAIAMLATVEAFNCRHGQNCDLRIGINTGPVVAGVIGTKKFIYDLWGDTVNIASRMESHGIPGKIQVTADTYAELQDEFLFEYRGEVAVKGKGHIHTYFLLGKKPVTAATTTV